VTGATATQRRPLTRASTVAALIPHYACDEWLGDALETLVAQTRPLDAIVVIDDASDEPPVEVVLRHEQVTLLQADRNGGPYRLVQQVIDDFPFDAYLFQDADDWTSLERLELLLAAAEDAGAEMVGTQEVRVFCDDPEAVPVAWPTDVNATLAERPTAFCLLHPTSLVSRDLGVALGGFATGLRFSGDAEFLRRAAHVARVVNIPERCYFRRIRPRSLTTARHTGLDSPARKRLMEALWERARSNAALAVQGHEPRLEPYATAPPVVLTHLAGPELTRAPITMAKEPV
jgi:hypothetical protein